MFSTFKKADPSNPSSLYNTRRKKAAKIMSTTNNVVPDPDASPPVEDALPTIDTGDDPLSPRDDRLSPGDDPLSALVTLSLSYVE